MNWRRNLIGSTVGRYDSREPRGVHVLMFARSLKDLCSQMILNGRANYRCEIVTRVICAENSLETAPHTISGALYPRYHCTL